MRVFAHYLEPLGGAGLLTGLDRYSGSRVSRRGSSPKLLALNNALITALRPDDSESGRRRDSLPGLDLFASRHPAARRLLVGGDGIDLEDFLLADPERWFPD